MQAHRWVGSSWRCFSPELQNKRPARPDNHTELPTPSSNDPDSAGDPPYTPAQSKRKRKRRDMENVTSGIKHSQVDYFPLTACC